VIHVSIIFSSFEGIHLDMNIAHDDGLISVEDNTDYKSLENNDFKSMTNHNNKCDKIINVQVKGENSIDIEPNMASNESDLNRNICKNFARINELLEAFPLCDHLFQHDVISMTEHSGIRLKWKSNHSDANDDLMKKLCKREYDPEILRKALNETKQTWVVKLLFPDQ
jgi:hypothetical protein